MTKLAYSVDEFAEAFGVGRTKVYDEIREGRLPIIKVGKRTIITLDGAAEWQRTLVELSADAAEEWRERTKKQTKKKSKCCSDQDDDHDDGDGSQDDDKDDGEPP